MGYRILLVRGHNVARRYVGGKCHRNPITEEVEKADGRHSRCQASIVGTLMPNCLWYDWPCTWVLIKWSIGFSELFNNYSTIRTHELVRNCDGLLKRSSFAKSSENYYIEYSVANRTLLRRKNSHQHHIFLVLVFIVIIVCFHRSFIHLHRLLSLVFAVLDSW